MFCKSARYKEDLPPLGLNWIKLGLQDVLYDPKTKTIYTPNMNQSMQMSENKVNFGENEVDNSGQSGIIEERDYIQNPDTGKMEGSTGEGASGGSGGGSGSSGGGSSGSTSSETKEQKILKQKVKDGELTKTIYAPKQELHYQGTKQHEDYTKTHGGIEKSYFTVPISELQSILDEKFATGRVHIFSDGKITEIFDCGKIVGYDTLLKRETSFVKVHYSKLKTHMVPHVKNG